MVMTQDLSLRNSVDTNIYTKKSHYNGLEEQYAQKVLMCTLRRKQGPLEMVKARVIREASLGIRARPCRVDRSSASERRAVKAAG